jgi:hypothetical protein
MRGEKGRGEGEERRSCDGCDVRRIASQDNTKHNTTRTLPTTTHFAGRQPSRFGQPATYAASAAAAARAQALNSYLCMQSQCLQSRPYSRVPAPGPSSSALLFPFSPSPSPSARIHVQLQPRPSAWMAKPFHPVKSTLLPCLDEHSRPSSATSSSRPRQWAPPVQPCM